MKFFEACLIVLLLAAAVSAVDITQCDNDACGSQGCQLTTSDTYNVLNDISNAGEGIPCLTLNTAKRTVIVDCASQWTISGGNAQDPVNVDGGSLSTLTVQNCHLTGGSNYGLNLVSGKAIANSNTIDGNQQGGIYAGSGTKLTTSSNSITTTNAPGINLDGAALGALSSDTISSGAQGIMLQNGATGNTLTNEGVSCSGNQPCLDIQGSSTSNLVSGGTYDASSNSPGISISGSSTGNNLSGVEASSSSNFGISISAPGNRISTTVASGSTGGISLDSNANGTTIFNSTAIGVSGTGFFSSYAGNVNTTNLTATGDPTACDISSAGNFSIRNSSCIGLQDIKFSPQTYCNDVFANVTGNRGLPIFYYNNTAVTVGNKNLSALFLCMANDSAVGNFTVNNSAINLYWTNSTKITNVTLQTYGSQAIEIDDGYYNAVANSSINSPHGYCITTKRSSYNNVTNVSCYSGTDGFSLFLKSSYNLLLNTSAFCPSGWDYYFDSGANWNNVTDFVSTSTDIPIWIGNADHNTMQNGRVNVGTPSIQFLNGTYNNLTNITVKGNTAFDTPSGKNLLTRNNFTGTHWLTDSNGSNFYNDSLAGNEYHYSNGTGVWVGRNMTCLGTCPWTNGGNQSEVNATTNPTQITGTGVHDFHPFTLNQLFPNTCTYVSGTWNINCADGCNITSPVDLTQNNIILNATSGYLNISTTISNFKWFIQTRPASGTCWVYINRAAGGRLRNG